MDTKDYQLRVRTRTTKSRSPLSPLFRAASSFRLLRSASARMVCHLEGGQMWSATFRDLMREHYGVEIGMHSYGSPLLPGGLPEGTRVGNYCSLADGIDVFRRNHPTNRFSQHPFFFNAASGLVDDDTIEAVRDHPLVVEDDVWIGANTLITARCQTIGLGAVVGAGSVVTKDVPPFAIMAGVPARRIGERFPSDIQREITESRWWNYTLEYLVPVLPLFLEDATLENARRLREHLRSCAPPA